MISGFRLSCLKVVFFLCLATGWWGAGNSFFACSTWLPQDSCKHARLERVELPMISLGIMMPPIQVELACHGCDGPGHVWEASQISSLQVVSKSLSKPRPCLGSEPLSEHWKKS